jgi:hypothetical protein
MTQGAPQEQDVPAGLTLDPSVPNPARIWNFWVGGKDHFEADRALAEQFGQVVPGMPLIAKLTSSSTSAPACPPPTTRTRSPSAWRRTRGSSTWTTTRWCSRTPARC